MANANVLFRCVLSTPPVACAPASEVEVHALVCRRDVNMLLLSAKSFVRFAPRAALVLHDDGSLRQKDFRLLAQHLPNARLIERPRADAELGRLIAPSFMALRKQHVLLLKLFDFNHYCRGRKLIALDSDLLFLQAPDVVLEWMKGDPVTCFYNQESADTFRAATPCDPGTVPRNLNSGFIGLPAPVSLEEIAEGMTSLSYAREDQTIYAWIFAKRESIPLDGSQYCIFTGGEIPPDARMVHFISTHRFARMTYVRLARTVCSELAR